MACAPLAYEWTGDSFVPLKHCVKMADKEFVIGEIYRLAIHEERSANTHRHYFAALHDAWMSLPEGTSERFPTEDHFRKWCLIKAGYRDERTIVASSKAEALRIAAFVKPMDEFAVVVVKEATVIVATAKSQSVRAMGKKEFQESKQAVLETAAEMIGLSAEMLAQPRRVAA